MFKKRIAAIALASAPFVCAAFGQTTTTATFTETFEFAPVGVASTESAQINIANIATASASGNAASCAGTVSFYNAAGTAIGSASSFTVAGGASSSTTVTGTAAGAATAGSRTVVRGVVTLTRTSGSNAPCSLLTSLETFDNATGVTHVHVQSAAGQTNIGPFGGR